MMYQAGFIGCGNMGGPLAAVAAKSVGGEQILTADHNQSKLKRLSESCGTIPATSVEAAEKSRFLFLGVKPQAMRRAAEEIRDTLRARTERCVVVTMAAGLTMETVSNMLGGCPMIRIMPNTPASVGEGVIPYCIGDGVTREEEAFLKLLRPAGVIVKLPENKIDMACALTGCGPAFVCMFMEAMTDAGVRCGLPREQAKLFAIQTVSGTAKLILLSDRDPAELRADVCSPAGSSIEGIAVLERRGLRSAVIDAIQAAYRRTEELSREGQ